MKRPLCANEVGNGRRNAGEGRIKMSKVSWAGLQRRGGVGEREGKEKELGGEGARYMGERERERKGLGRRGGGGERQRDRVVLCFSAVKKNCTIKSNHFDTTHNSVQISLFKRDQSCSCSSSRYSIK